MNNIKWKLTLWWRTLTEGPMCQRCEGRHWGTTFGKRQCDRSVEVADLYASMSEWCRKKRERKRQVDVDTENE